LGINVLTVDDAGRPVIGVQVELKLEQRRVATGEVNEVGRISFLDQRPGVYTITATKNGFLPAEKKDVDLSEGNVTLELEIVPVPTRTDSVEVRGTVVEVEGASVPNTLPPEKAKELPSRPATVADVLPLTPGVVREPGGALILSSSPESRSALIVNSADVTDPGTGQFGLTVPIDSVEVLNVYQTAYLAEYGRFTSGLVSVETKRGGDKWKWELNDPLPEFRIRSWHLRGLKTATPRINFEGPLIKSKLFFSQGLEYEIHKTAVYTLPFPFNQKKTQGLNSFSQIDWVASARHLLTATLHAAPQRLEGLNLDYYNPSPTTPDGRTRNLTGTISDHLTLWGGLWENRFSTTYFDGSVWGQGPGGLTISPTGNSGYYFADQSRAASRISGNSSYSFAPLPKWGTHQFKIGAYFAGSEHSGDIVERPIRITDVAGHDLVNIDFPRTRNFEVSDLERSFFVQDHWIVSPRLAIDIGARSESQQISGATRIAPRAGFSWVPLERLKTILRGGAGYFYDRVPLNVYAFNRYPGRVETTYDSAGNTLAGPTLFVNTLGQDLVRRPFVSQSPTDGNFSPRSLVWSAQAEQPVTKWLKARVTYLRNDSDSLVILDRVEPTYAGGQGAYLLQGTGSSRYRQLDFTAQVRLRNDRELFFSYVRSRAQGDLNDFGRFLGTVQNPIIRANQYGKLGTDLPNRFLAWGVVRLPMKFQIAPVVEYRSGFPYVQSTVNQQYFGVPNSTRFPNFFSIDSRFSKDLKINKDYSIRVSVSAFNLTNHFNPEQVHSNVADPAFGYFFGHRGRRFTVDFDFLF
jgi:hypothetical protein